MERFARDCLLLLLLVSSIRADGSNDSSIEDHRAPRVSGRIVKIYSGNRPEPFLCIDDGYKADPHNCASFYRCVKERNGNFSVFRYQCAPGTVYDPDLETCNHARNTRRTECGGVMKPIPEAVDFNEVEPHRELPRPMNTNSPDITKETIQYTGSPWVTPSSSHRTKTTIHLPSTFAASFADTTKHNTGYYNGVTTNAPLMSSTKRKQDWPKITSVPKLEKNTEICSYDGFTGDVEDCRKFYRCVGSQSGGFLRYEFFCSESTVWDERIQSCNHPWAVKRSKCGRSMTFEEKFYTTETSSATKKSTTLQSFSTAEYGQKNMKTIQEQLQISYGSKVTQTQTQISHSNDVIQNQTQIHYGDRLNQSKNSGTKQNQTQITHGSAVSQTQTQLDYGHKGVQTQLQIDHSKNSSQSQTLIESTTSDTATSKQDFNQNHSNQCFESGFIGDANNCKKFYRCVDSGRGTFLKYEYMCGDGTVWDSSIEACNHAWAVKDCGSQSHPESGGQTHTEPQISSTMKSTTYFDTTTQSYHSSENPDIDDIDVGYGNQVQSETTTALSTSSSVQTTTTKKPKHDPTECSSNGFIGDTNDCKKFYRCVDNGRGTFTKHEFKCGEGTVWDSDIEACNHEWAVKRCGGTSSNNDKGETTSTSDNVTVQSTVTLIQTTTQLSTTIDDYDSGYGSPGTESTSKPIKTTKKPQSDTTKSPQYDANNECKSSGFMGDSNNCKKFYRCVDNGMEGFTRHEFTCGEGTAWDPSIEACNHAWAVEKCGSKEETSESYQTTEKTSTSVVTITTPTGTTTSQPIHTSTIIISSTSSSNTTQDGNGICKNSGFIGDDTDCKKFYRCVDNGDGTYTRYEFTCGEGTVWDPNTEACNHIWAVERCGGSSESTKPTFTSTSQYPTLQDEEQENEPTMPSLDNSSTTQSSTTTKVNEISTSNQICNGIGFIGDQNDCKKFYRCVDNGRGGYDQYQFYCGEGTVWDKSISACNHAWAVKYCGSSSINTPQSNNESSSNNSIISTVDHGQQENTQHSTEKSSTTTSNALENEVSDENCKEGGFFGSISDCKKFFRCVDDGNGSYTKYEFTCGEGTTWNQHIQACDHPSPDRSCTQNYQSTTIVTQINDEMETETTTKLTSTSLSDKEEPQVTQKPQSSSGKCESEGFYGDLSDCKKFYRCVDNGKGGYTKYEFICGEGTVWNQEIQACDHESDDKQCLSSVSSSPSEVSSGSTDESRPQSESTTSSTNDNQVTHKTESPHHNNECSSDGFFAHPHDCKKFVRCVSNGNGGYTRYEFSCGEGTVWVQEIQACDHDNDFTNCSSQNEFTKKPQEHSQESSTTESTSYWGTESQTAHTPHKEDDEYPTIDQPSNKENNKCTSEGYFANKNDCRKFYRCVDNGSGGYTKYDFDCGEGTAWDDSIGNCNHINEVASCSETNKEESQSMKDEDVTDSTEGTSTKGTTSSSSSESTTSSSSTKPTEESGSGSNDNCELEGFYGDSKDCKKFYRCVDDGKGGLTKYDFTCADGTIWDKDITNCNYPQDVINPSCKSGEEGGGSQTSSSTSSATTSSPQSSTSSNTSENSSQSSSNCSQEDSSKKPASSKDISCEKAGYYPNPNDCKKFYRCVDWDGDGKRFSVYHFECGEGTIWDPALDTCNHEESVYPPRDCSKSQSQLESSSSGTTEKQDETTTQESTTSEKTTIEESATSEQSTTQQPTTSEQTTAQQPTTSEQTTTQQSSTSEKTTTQKSTTSEQTTTQKSTTSEKTTTQKSTTSQPTTTKQSTTSQQTTSQQPTTSEQTTQESTTSEQTTTEESTTSAQTTTQDSTTSEQSTTQESQTTTEQTTEQTNGQTGESSTTEGTTESSTTEANGGSSTTEQSSATTESEQQSTTESSSEKECPETDDDQNLFVCPTSFKRHPKYCNMFYQCTEDDDTHELKIASFKCPNETIYDESKTQCVEEKKADKQCDGEIARRHIFKRVQIDSKEPITVDNDKKSCPAVGYYPFEKNIECSNGFLKCERSKSGKMRGYVHQCPEGYLFWTISKRCELLENIRDCKRSSNDWKGRWNIPVDRKNVA